VHALVPASRLISLANVMDFLPFIIVFVIFWLLVFRPSSKERKQREDQIKNLKKHDRVITNAGIHGVVVALEPESVILRVDEKNNVRIRFSRAAIWQVNPEGAAPAEPLPDTADEAAGAGAR
jgi:preprotein translocase subunit YajC